MQGFSAHYKLCIIGAGFGGIAMAIRLLQQGINDFIILEKSDQIGGTWRDNQYPGAACDVQSHMYSLSFAAKTDWSKRYADAAEILAYLKHISQDYSLEDYCRFGQEVVATHYQTDTCNWNIHLKNSEVISCQYIVLASGPLHVPQIPHIKGIENFQGKVFHSAQWDHQYNLKNKKVASIGTGGSAIQYVPEIAEQVKHLYVMQRSAAWVIPRDERAYTAIEKTLFAQHTWFRKLHRTRLYWSNESRFLPIVRPHVMKYAQKLVEGYIRYQVKDADLAKKLTPQYIMGCKRILISNRYYPTFTRPNVDLVTEDIQEIKANSIVTKDGVEREIDCLIYGTGFITDPRIYLKHFDCTGLNGIELKQAWADGAESYYGIVTKNFPNLFQLLGPNTVLAHNSVVFMIESQVNYILQLLDVVERTKCHAIMVKPQVHDEFNQQLQAQLKNTIWQSGCVSWYQNTSGKNFALWPHYTWQYWLKTKTVNMSDYQLFEKTKSVVMEEANVMA